MNWKLPQLPIKGWPAGGLAAIATALGSSLGLVAAANADERRVGRGRPSTPASAQARKAGYETTEMSARIVGLVLATIVVSYAILIGGIFFMVGHLSHGDRITYSGYSAQQTKAVTIPLPRLEVHPLATYQAYHAHQMHRLDHYYKLPGGYARIPINRAMDLVRGQSLDAQDSGNQPSGNQS